MLNNNNKDTLIEEDKLSTEANQQDSAIKPHIIRRNIEDYLEQKKLKRRLKDIFDDDFLLD